MHFARRSGGLFRTLQFDLRNRHRAVLRTGSTLRKAGNDYANVSLGVPRRWAAYGRVPPESFNGGFLQVAVEKLFSRRPLKRGE